MGLGFRSHTGLDLENAGFKDGLDDDFMGFYGDFMEFYGIYHLVILLPSCEKIHYFQWENPLLQWSFSILKLPEEKYHGRPVCDLRMVQDVRDGSGW